MDPKKPPEPGTSSFQLVSTGVSLNKSSEGRFKAEMRLLSCEGKKAKSDQDGTEEIKNPDEYEQNAIRKADEKTSRNFKMYRKLIQKITCIEDVQTLGLYLGCDPYDIEYQLNLKQPRQTAYKILLWFESNYADEVVKWTKLIEALTEMGKNTTVVELGLCELLNEAASVGKKR